MDIIHIQDLRVNSRIGVADYERALVRPLILQIDIGIPRHVAAQRDDIADTIDYAVVVNRVMDELSAKPFHLLETVADYVASLIVRDFSASWVKVRVDKPGILAGVGRVGVTVERSA